MKVSSNLPNGLFRSLERISFQQTELNKQKMNFGPIQ